MAARISAPSRMPIDDPRLTALAVSDDPFVLDRLDALLGEMNIALTRVAWRGDGDGERTSWAGIDLLLIETALWERCGFAQGAVLHDAPAMVVFLSTDSDAALRAFDNGAIGFLTKPLDRGHVERTVERARARHNQRQARLRIAETENLIDAMAAHATPEAIWVRHRGGEWLRVRGDAIDWLQVQDDYVCIRAGGRDHLVRGSLDHWLDTLGGDRFVRIHRRVAVAPDRIVRLPGEMDAQVQLRDGTLLPVGRVHGRSLARLATG